MQGRVSWSVWPSYSYLLSNKIQGQLKFLFKMLTFWSVFKESTSSKIDLYTGLINMKNLWIKHTIFCKYCIKSEYWKFLKQSHSEKVG